MYKLSKGSDKKLSTCHKDLQLIMREAIGSSTIDFGISEGHRTLETQQKHFKNKKSTCDGINRKSKHQSSPSLAVDIYAFYNGKAQWDDIHLAYLGGHILRVAGELYSYGEVTHKLRWGANWDGDGILVYDHTLKDLPHFELV
jgi:peptidoglycan L-alanyl-D-glutamate endopeptidase CwlK